MNTSWPWDTGDVGAVMWGSTREKCYPAVRPDKLWSGEKTRFIHSESDSYRDWIISFFFRTMVSALSEPKYCYMLHVTFYIYLWNISPMPPSNQFCLLKCLKKKVNFSRIWGFEPKLTKKMHLVKNNNLVVSSKWLWRKQKTFEIHKYRSLEEDKNCQHWTIF